MSFLYLSHIGRRFPKEPIESSLRVAFASVSISGFMVITLYRSMISASLAVKIFEHPVESLDEIVDSPFNLIVSNGSSVHRMILEGKPGSDFERIVKSGKLKPMKSESEGFKHIIEGKFDVSRESMS